VKPTSTVYVLKPELTDPRFEGFVFGDEASSVLGLERAYDDFMVDDAESLDWRPRRLKAAWKPQPVTGPVNPFNDYPCLEVAKPVLSRRAVDVLGDMLIDNGELLPLKADVGEYYAYVLMTKLDALDVRKSRLRRSSPDKTAVAIRYFAFKKSKLASASIFRVPEHPNLYLVTDCFKDRVEQAGLNGFRFIKVWPLPEESDWKLQEAVRRKKSKAVKLVGQALILRFRLKKDKASTHEMKLAAEIQDSLASKLKVEALQDRYWGSIEVAEIEDGEFRAFCTCPNCDELAEYLTEWFEEVPWEYDFDIVKRYGNLYDQKAKEKLITIRKASA